MIAQRIDSVHLIFKTHLDVGFTDFAEGVVANYFTHFIPKALELAQMLRQRGGSERFIWTTGAWLIYEYLEHAAPPDRRRMEQAITAGDIVWHGLPFTTHSELMDAALFEYGLGLAQALDQRFGKKTIAAKMTDVPGHTRGIVPLLADAGIRFLHLGVNGASTPPDVPPVFVWRDPSQKELIVMYQKGGYGDLVTVPGMAEALAFAHTDDNRGPQSAEQVVASFQALRNRLPGAHIVASTMDAFAKRLLEVKAQLPVVTGEIGDTWIHGVGTDPHKVSRFRELCRLRSAWLAQGRAQPGEPAFGAFSRFLLMVPEHTWGMDEKTHLANYTNYAADQLHIARMQPNFKRFEASWSEQRAYLDSAIAALGESPLAREALERLAAIAPTPPSRPDAATEVDPRAVFETAHFTLGFDPEHGALSRMTDRASGRDWASAANMLALLRYETFSDTSYERFWRQYIVNKRATARWSRPDFTKPGLAALGGEQRFWLPLLAQLYLHEDNTGFHFHAELRMPAECSTSYGCPRRIVMQFGLPHAEPAIYLNLQWFDKPACRRPEALWLSFAPVAPHDAGWRLEKLGQWVSPREVVRNGNRTLHAVGAGMAYHDAGGQLMIETLDAPLVAPGAPSLLNFHNRQPRLRQGMHVNLYNNVWGTNFPMWYEEDARFRFVLRATRPC